MCTLMSLVYSPFVSMQTTQVDIENNIKTILMQYVDTEISTLRAEFVKEQQHVETRFKKYDPYIVVRWMDCITSTVLFVILFVKVYS